MSVRQNPECRCLIHARGEARSFCERWKMLISTRVSSMLVYLPITARQSPQLPRIQYATASIWKHRNTTSSRLCPLMHLTQVDSHIIPLRTDCQAPPRTPPALSLKAPAAPCGSHHHPPRSARLGQASSTPDCKGPNGPSHTPKLTQWRPAHPMMACTAPPTNASPRRRQKISGSAPNPHEEAPWRI